MFKNFEQYNVGFKQEKHEEFFEVTQSLQRILHVFLFEIYESVNSFQIEMV